LYNKLNQWLRHSAARPWQKGQRGNPGGTSKGARRNLTDAFIRALARDWQVHGEAVIKRVRDDNPVAYFKGMLSLVQKDIGVEGELKQAPLDTEPLSATLAWIEQVLSESEHPSRDTQPAKHNSETAVGYAVGQTRKPAILTDRDEAERDQAGMNGLEAQGCD
jgi:hypothetical protein